MCRRVRNPWNFISNVPGNTVTTIPPEVLAITTTTLPDGVASRDYAFFLTATGGMGAFTWTAATPLPAGLTVDPASGEVTDIPTAPGSFSSTVQVQDAGSRQIATRLFTLVVQEPLSIVNTALLNGLRDSNYKQTLAATGGLPAYTWSNPEGTPPPGTMLMAAAGVLEGTAATAGSFSFTIRVEDTGNAATPPCTVGLDCPERNFTVLINEALVYVTGIDGLSVIDTTSNLVVATIPGFTWVGVALVPDGRFAYVAELSP